MKNSNFEKFITRSLDNSATLSKTNDKKLKNKTRRIERKNKRRVLDLI